MKLSGAKVDQFLRRPDEKTVAVLLFGPDQGLVRERAENLALTVVDDLNDPFRVVELSGADLKADPPRLVDEAAQLSMIGGRRVIFLREATDGLSAILKDFIESGPGGNLVIVEAGNLGKASPLRQLFERAKNACAIGCYEDDGRALETVIRDTLGRHGLIATPDALAFLAGNLGGDRLITRGEIEKLALYVNGRSVGPAGKLPPVTLEDAESCIGDSAAMSLDALVHAVGGGDATGIDRALERAFGEGVTPVRVLRAVQGHFHRLHVIRAKVEAGESLDSAVQSLRPPVFFKYKNAFQAQARRWRMEHMATALMLLTEAELDCKSTGIPAAAVCHRALMRIAQAGRAGGR